MSGPKRSSRRFVTVLALFAFIFLLPLLEKSSAVAYSVPKNEDGVIYPSNAYVKMQKKKNNEVRTPDAEKIHYNPVRNDVKRDPLDDGYEEWLNEVRDRSLIDADIDSQYEDFIKEVSPLIFSLGDEKLTPEARDLLAGIPPDALDYVGRDFMPKGPIDLNREAPGSDPFEGAAEAEEEILGRDLGLQIEVSDPRNDNDELLGMAYEAMKMGQAEGAASIYEEILTKDPNNDDAMFGLATTYHRIGQFDEARDTYIKLLTKNPNNWEALNNFMLLAGEEAPLDALKELKALELLNPEFAPIPAQIGLIYLRLNKPQDAIKNLTRSIILSPDNLAYRYNLAIVLDHAGHKKQAARLYQQLLKANKMGYKLPESSQAISERLAFIAASPMMVR